jgi:signal transduction histidine kinase
VAPGRRSYAADMRNVLIDAGLGAAVAAVLAVAIAADVGGPGPPPAAYLFALGFGALMLLRRSFPVPVLVATAGGLLGYYMADLPPIGLALPVAGALFSAAEAGRTRWAIGVAAALVLVATGFRLREGDDPAYLLGFDLAATVGLMAGAIALGDGVRSRRRLRAELRRRAERAALEKEQEAARRVEAERLWIARELHDVLGHTVALISVQAAVAAEALADEDQCGAAAALSVIRTAGGEAMAELRATVGSLRAPGAGLAPASGLHQLDRLADTMTGSGLPVTVTVDGQPVTLPVVVDTTAYRIVQEALTNTLRHAHANRAEVALHYGRAELRIVVTDDGRGGNTDTPGQGLRGMTERAALLGGTVTAGNREAGGFLVAATLPLGDRPDNAVVTG